MYLDNKAKKEWVKLVKKIQGPLNYGWGECENRGIDKKTRIYWLSRYTRILQYHVSYYTELPKKERVYLVDA